MMPPWRRVSGRMIGMTAPAPMSGVRGKVAVGSLKMLLARRLSSR